MGRPQSGGAAASAFLTGPVVKGGRYPGEDSPKQGDELI
jgi:hypothetical protein